MESCTTSTLNAIHGAARDNTTRDFHYILGLWLDPIQRGLLLSLFQQSPILAKCHYSHIEWFALRFDCHMPCHGDIQRPAQRTNQNPGNFPGFGGMETPPNVGKFPTFLGTKIALCGVEPPRPNSRFLL